MKSPALLDTDTLSYLMRRDPAVLRNAAIYLADHGRLTLSIITRYEILRGLKAKQATAQLAAFEQFCTANNVLGLSDVIVVRAAANYGDLYRRGLHISDADNLIAATAQEHQLILVTNNQKHFANVAGLQLSNWAGP
jgi:tRNA(fMet)-specific endonuclease VapC